MHRRPSRRGVPPPLFALVLALGACTAGPAPASDGAVGGTARPSPEVTASASVVVSPSPEPASATPPTTEPPATAAAVPSAPPEAAIAAEGGDPVVGRLGTYTWGETGSDAPWLPGSPVAVGAGEPLTIGFEPSLDVERWSLTLHEPDAMGPEGGIPLADGAGSPTAAAPASGAYTLLLEVRFAGGLGAAVYAWRLDVR